MPTYVEILDTEIAAEQPVTVSLITRLRDNALAYKGAPTNTIEMIGQTSAPTGWTKLTDHNDKALRVVSGTVGSGGSVAFSTVFGRTATDSHTLDINQIPAHTHTTPTQPSNGTFAGGGDNGSVNGSATTGSAGGGQGHTHNMDLRVQYVDVIRIQKAA